MDLLVCPQCGNARFTTTLTTRTEFTYSAFNNGGIFEQASEVTDGGDLGDAEEFTCTDCGEKYDELNNDTLTTRNAWVEIVNEEYR